MDKIEQIVVILLVGACLAWGVRALWRMVTRRETGGAPGCAGCTGCSSARSRVPCDPAAMQNASGKQQQAQPHQRQKK